LARTSQARAPIRLLVLDVDGVLTDGRLYYGARGQTLQAFHVRDGHGIKAVLAAGTTIAVISGRRTRGVVLRCRELGIREVHQGVADKLACLSTICRKLKIKLSDCAAIGDDSPDAPVLRAVGVSYAVADAHADARRAATHVTRLRGGRGAVREVCDTLLARRPARHNHD
jgi:3-deoxy-D-manno-octulosonate 8-phosphate phosphatase (KDO 8-P phosphatase)